MTAPPITFGLSSQDTSYQREVAERLHLPFQMLSDPALNLAAALGLPTFDHCPHPSQRNTVGHGLAQLCRITYGAVLDWDHNAYYHRLLLRQMPQPCRRVLDVGCGAGAFAARLAERSEQVDALDRSAEMIEQAKRRTPANVNCVLADVLAGSLPDRDYDAVFSISALHHMPLQDALPVLAAALRPGGVLVAIALPRPDLRRELPAEIVAAAGHRLLGAMFLMKRLLGSNNGFAKDSARATMPVVMAPALTTREVARQAAAVLPGVRVRRLLFWRYLLIWQKPITPGS